MRTFKRNRRTYKFPAPCPMSHKNPFPRGIIISNADLPPQVLWRLFAPPPVITVPAGHLAYNRWVLSDAGCTHVGGSTSMLVSVDSLTADPSRKTINSVRETAASIVTHEISPAIAHITKPMVAMRLGALEGYLVMVK